MDNSNGKSCGLMVLAWEPLCHPAVAAIAAAAIGVLTHQEKLQLAGLMFAQLPLPDLMQADWFGKMLSVPLSEHLHEAQKRFMAGHRNLSRCRR